MEQTLNEPSSFLPAFTFGVIQIATDRRAPFKVFPLVSWCEPSENLIGFSSCLDSEWELLINSARVDEKRSF